MQNKIAILLGCVLMAGCAGVKGVDAYKWDSSRQTIDFNPAFIGDKKPVVLLVHAVDTGTIEEVKLDTSIGLKTLFVAGLDQDLLGEADCEQGLCRYFSPGQYDLKLKFTSAKGGAVVVDVLSIVASLTNVSVVANQVVWL